MMLYKSDFLSIKYTNDIFFQEWSGLEISETIFKQELLNFLELFLHHKPKNLLWDNRKFNLVIPEVLNEWIEREIMMPQYENGLKKLTFIVTPDVYVQQTVIKSVESFKPFIKSYFFLTKQEALHFILNDEILIQENHIIQNLTIDKLENNDYELKLQIHNEILEDTVIALSDITKFNEYRKLYQETYDALTVKEKIIIRQMVYGASSKEIADALNIQPDTVNTHKKNLKRKINFKNSFELVYFAKAFGIISF